jgi:hypothetical protein
MCGSKEEKFEMKRGYRLRDGDQVPTKMTTVLEVMSQPHFALGVADKRAGRGYRADYDCWGHSNHRWAYDRGRLWATLAPKTMAVKRNGKVTDAAMNVYAMNRNEIL